MLFKCSASVVDGGSALIQCLEFASNTRRWTNAGSMLGQRLRGDSYTTLMSTIVDILCFY